jgi:hypothetical protein
MDNQISEVMIKQEFVDRKGVQMEESISLNDSARLSNGNKLNHH